MTKPQIYIPCWIPNSGKNVLNFFMCILRKIGLKAILVLDLVSYYLKRWSHENLISSYNANLEIEKPVEHTFINNPQKLIDDIHAKGIGPFNNMLVK